MNNEFTCAKCHLTFTKVRSDEEAIEEAQKEFGPYEPSECASLCDNCYREFEKWLESMESRN